MKILHVAQDPGAALVAEQVVHGIAQNVALTWAGTPAGAVEWLLANRDTAAVIVEMHAQSCAPFVEQLRGLGIATPVVVVARFPRLEPALAAMNSGADGYVVAGPSLEDDLPRTVAAAIDRARGRRHTLTQLLTELGALEQQAARAEDARRQTEQRSASELAAAAARLADIEARHASTLARETRICTTLQQRLFELESALRTADERRASDAVSSADQLAKRHAEFTASLAQAAQSRDALAAELNATIAALDEARQARRADAAAASEHLRAREAVLRTEIAEAAAVRAALESALAEAETAHEDTRQRAASDLAAANERQAALDDLLTQEADRCASFERKLAAAETALQQTERWHAAETARTGAALAELQALHDAAVEENVAGKAEQDRLRRQLETRESELQRISGEYTQLHDSFDRLQSSFQTLEQIAGDHAAERARLEAVVTDRDAQLSAQAERNRAAEQAAQDARAALEDEHRRAIGKHTAENTRLQQEIESLRRELDASRTHAEALRGVAERVPDLQADLERSRSERRRQFERAPYALCICSQDGAITDANHSFVTLLGCRRADELRNTSFVAAALDSAGDLGWLLERARTTRKTETVETHWQTRDGRRLVVRLQAIATAAGSIEIVAEDISAVRTLEERLRQAQRMEAVGRLAAEVAVTCDGLLQDVARGADEWLGSAGGDATVRRQAERLLTDVTRAASFLRQLGAYGNEQARALAEPVSAQRVLRDLAPVLKRLVGDDIELVLPKASGSFHVDVDARRLERIFTNIAGYARERMASGGQVRIDLATTAVGRRFSEKYSHVRPGDHVLVTVTELPAPWRSAADSGESRRSPDRPGLDLGVLVDLVGSCGGHLWLEAQPAGNMVVKIHLPKPPAANVADSRPRRFSRWFRSASAARVRA